jgi:Zn-dependent peptidase ImmA (M78 family)
MYKPVYKTARNGVPILKKHEIDTIAENFLWDFCPEAMKTPREIDIDSFAQNYLGLKQDFQYLSNNGIYLGMMVFNNTDKIIVYKPETNTAEYISEEARTIIIDNNLLEEKQEHRYRYTVVHECGHDIFHTEYFHHDTKQISFLEPEPMIKCRAINPYGNKKPVHLWNEKDSMEWQANYMASSLLMPKSMVIEAVKNHNDFTKSLKYHFDVTKDELTIWAISKIFNVSTEATQYRLKGLGLIGNTKQLTI